MDFNTYFKKYYNSTETYLIAGLRVRIMTQEYSIYKAINKACFVKAVDRRKQPDITIMLVSKPDLSQILTNSSEHPDWQTVFNDFSIFEDFKNNYNVIYVKYIQQGKTLFTAGLCHKNKILVFIDNRALPKSSGFSIVTILLHFLMRTRNLFALHAAYMTKNGTNILFSGKSGCGKTTIAMNLIRSGFICRSDDISFLSCSNSDAMVYPFPKRMLRVDFKAKKIVKVKDKYSCYKMPSIPNFIVFPRISPINKSKLIPISQNKAMIKILNNFMFLFKMDKDRYIKSIKLLRKLVSQCRCYSLISGSDIMESPSKLNIILESLIRKPI